MKKLLLSLVACLALTGCPGQSDISVLVSTLGNATSEIAAIEGNPTLSAKIKTDSAAASSAVLNWKKGSNGQMAIEALNLVLEDLQLVPAIGPYAPLIQIGVVTAEAIIAELDPSKATVNAALASAPRSRKAFVKKWNAQCATSPALAKLKIE